MKVLRRILLWFVGALAFIMLALELVLRFFCPAIVDRFVAPKLPFELRYSDVKGSLFKDFPLLRLDVDTLKVSEYGSFDRLSVGMNPWRLVKGDVYVADLALQNFNADLPLGSGRLGVKGSVYGESVLLRQKDSLSFCVDTLYADVRGLNLGIKASGTKLRGTDPRVDFHGILGADLGAVATYLPDTLALSADGDLDVVLDAHVALNELDNYRFRNTRLKGHVHSNRADVALDSLTAGLNGVDLRLGGTYDGIGIALDLDSLRFSNDSMRVRVASMKNSASLTKVDSRFGGKTHRLSAETSSGGIVFRNGSNRIFLMGVDVATSATRIPRPGKGFARPSMPDSLSARRDSVPDYLSEREFAEADIKLDFGEQAEKILKTWNPEFSIKVRRGMAATPALPLRIRLNGISAGLSEGKLTLDSLSLRAGTSDLRASGVADGIRGAILRRGTVGLDLDVDARRINVNEILAAVEYGQSHKLAEPEDEEDYGLDSLSGEKSFLGGKLFVVPANVIGDIQLKADTVDYSSLRITPLTADLSCQARTLQLRNALVNSNLGALRLDAYYSTRTKSDISAGLNMKMVGMSADKIISLLPMVDSLMPLLKSFKGVLGCQVCAVTQLDTNMNVVLPSAKGVIRISGEDLFVEDAGGLRKITRLLLFRNKNIGRIQNLYVDATLDDGKIQLYPFILGVDRYTIALSGTQGLDKSFNYHASLLKTPLLIPFGINVYGAFDKWKFRITRAQYRNGKVPVFTKEIDDLQLNLAEGIRDIYRKGVDEVRNFNRMGGRMIALRSQELVPPEDLSIEEINEINAAVLDQQADEEMDAVLAECDTILENYEK